MFAVRVLSLILIVSSLAACTGMSEQACLATDWRTVGFEDGTSGRPVGTISNHRQACARHGIAPDLATYRAGHADGVEVYCRPTRGFDVGRRGQRYQGVCPVDLEIDFLSAYNAGRHLYELESAVRRIDNQIASNQRAQTGIRNEMTDIAASIASSESTAEERVRFVARAAELGQRYAEISAETDALQHERVLRSLELEDYQQTLAFGL
jgi:hypothetical protein